MSREADTVALSRQQSVLFPCQCWACQNEYVRTTPHVLFPPLKSPVSLLHLCSSNKQRKGFISCHKPYIFRTPTPRTLHCQYPIQHIYRRERREEVPAVSEGSEHGAIPLHLCRQQPKRPKTTTNMTERIKRKVVRYLPPSFQCALVARFWGTPSEHR